MNGIDPNAVNAMSLYELFSMCKKVEEITEQQKSPKDRKPIPVSDEDFTDMMDNLEALCQQMNDVRL